MTDTPASAGAAAPAKADPETLVLRASPARVVRFRRGAIIAIAALGSTAIASVAWLGLKPASLSLVASGEDRQQIGAKAPPDALANAPKSYGEVPQLGPPLPGDLGRPILNHQREIGTASLDPAAEAAAKALQEAEAERQRIAAERKAARESGVMMQLAGATRIGMSVPAAADPVTDSASPAPTPTGNLASEPERDPNAQQRKAAFVADKDESGDINPHALTPPASPYTLMAGSIIAASLITGLNSDLPGLVTAQVTENVYDSATGRIPLVPQGARLIGRYQSVVAFGQSRALVVWQRIILPDGSSIRIDNVPTTDSAGYAGLEGKVDFHTWRLLKGVAIATLLGVVTELSMTGESDLVEAIRESAQSNTARAGDRITQRNLDIQPTITIRPGAPVRLIVHKDMILEPWHGESGR